MFWLMTLFLHGLVFAPDTITTYHARHFTEDASELSENTATLSYKLYDNGDRLKNPHSGRAIGIFTNAGSIHISNGGTETVHYCLQNTATGKWMPKKELPVHDVRRVTLGSVTIVID